MVKKAALLLATLLLVPFFPAGCGKAPRRPNVLLVVVDTLRSDFCSCYNPPAPGAARTTPTLDRLAAEGARFDTVYSPIPTTGPAHSSLFTAKPPLVHGVVKNGHTLPESMTTLAEVLSGAGYETAAFVSSFAVNHKFGCAQGFGLYDDDFRGCDSSFRAAGIHTKGDQGFFDRRANETTDKALKWLRQWKEKNKKEEKPFFLWLHYFDPHFPYVPPPRFGALFPPASSRPSKREIVRSRYSGEVRFADEEIGRFMAALENMGLGRDTLVVFTADHGEGLFDHGWEEHGFYLYEEAVRVPLVLRWPGRIPKGVVIGEPAALIDAAPTILDLVKVPAGELAPLGRSLLPLIAAAGERGTGVKAAPSPSGNGSGSAKEEPQPRDGAEPGAAASPGAEPGSGGAARPILMERRLYETPEVKGHPVDGDKFALRLGRWKYIEALEEGTRELYDLAADPGELHNAAASRPKIAGRLARILKERVRALRSLAPRIRQAVTEEDAKRLEALGYTR